ncbi:porin [Salinicola sp. NYA28a]|jgi:hypothetical protein
MKNLASCSLAAIIASTTSLLILSTPAQAFSFKVSGQVDKAIVGADNGEESDIGFVDNNGSNTRFRFLGSQELNNGVEFGFNYEVALTNNLSTNFDINTSDTDSTFLDVRKTEVYLIGDLGKVSLGKGDGAANGTSEVDLSGTQYLGGGSAHYYASGISFLDPDGNPIGTIGGAAYNNFDALSRNNRIRYDTPSLGDVVLSASLDSGKAVETAARYATDFGDGWKFETAVDYLDSRDQNANINQAGERIFSGRFKEYGGSASVLLPGGLNFTGMYKNRDSDEGGPDGQSYFGGIGYILNKHHLQVGWGHTDDLANEGSSGNTYQLAYMYQWREDLEFFGSYRHITLDDAESASGDIVDAQNINYIYLGTRVKFL